MKNFVNKHWFVMGLLAAVAGAWAAPGLLIPDKLAGTVKFGCILGIFLVSGLTLPTAQMRSSLGNWRLHLFVQLFNFGLIPLFFLALTPLLAALGMDPVQRQGFIILACVPTTVATSVAITALGGGNEAGAICNAALGNLLGVFLSPFLICLLLSTQYQGMNYLSVIRELSLLVLLPIFCGQALQAAGPGFWLARRRSLGMLSHALLITIVYTVFSATFKKGLALSGGALLATLAVAALGHLILLWLSWRLSPLPPWRLSRPDRVAALICSTQKTVAMGVPLVTVLYRDNPEVAGLIILPLLCHHPLQLFIDSLAASSLHRGADHSA